MLWTKIDIFDFTEIKSKKKLHELKLKSDIFVKIKYILKLFIKKKNLNFLMQSIY